MKVQKQKMKDKVSFKPRKPRSVLKTCLECQRKKRKCDGQLPCFRCVKSKSEHKCDYRVRKRRKSKSKKDNGKGYEELPTLRSLKEEDTLTLSLDESQTITHCTSAFMNYMGVADKNLILGQPISDLIPCWKKQSSEIFEGYINKMNGTQHIVRIQKNSIKQLQTMGRKLETIVRITDIDDEATNKTSYSNSGSEGDSYYEDEEEEEEEEEEEGSYSYSENEHEFEEVSSNHVDCSPSSDHSPTVEHNHHQHHQLHYPNYQLHSQHPLVSDHDQEQEEKIMKDLEKNEQFLTTYKANATSVGISHYFTNPSTVQVWGDSTQQHFAHPTLGFSSNLCSYSSNGSFSHYNELAHTSTSIHQQVGSPISACSSLSSSPSISSLSSSSSTSSLSSYDTPSFETQPPSKSPRTSKKKVPVNSWPTDFPNYSAQVSQETKTIPLRHQTQTQTQTQTQNQTQTQPQTHAVNGISGYYPINQGYLPNSTTSANAIFHPATEVATSNINHNGNYSQDVATRNESPRFFTLFL